MAVPYSNTKLRVPKGFQNVLESLAREVLRVQPQEIYSFSAAYFEELLRLREETGKDDIAVLGMKLEDRFYNNHSFKNFNSNDNNAEQEDAAVKIQSEYRRFAAKKEVGSMKEEEAATKIQASFRGHIERKKLKDGRSGSKAPVAQPNVDPPAQSPASPENDELTEDAPIDEVKEDDAEQILETMPDAPTELPVEEDDGGEPVEEPQEEAAEPTEEPEDKEDNRPTFDIDLDDPELNKAAVKIQSTFKGYRTRKEIDEEEAVETLEPAEAIDQPNQAQDEEEAPIQEDEAPVVIDEDQPANDDNQELPAEEPGKEEEAPVDETAPPEASPEAPSEPSQEE